MVQPRLFPLLAECLALNFTGWAIMALYHKATAAQHGRNEPKNENGLPNARNLFVELRTNSYGLKAFATSAAAPTSI